MTSLQLKNHSNGGKPFGFLRAGLHWQNVEEVINKFISHLPFHHNAHTPRLESSMRIEPNVDIVKNSKYYKMTAELPGLSVKDIHLDLSDDVLTLSAQKSYEHEDRNKNYHLVERRFGSYKRTFSIPSSIDQGGINADFKQGVLKITFPKSKVTRQQQRKISIRS
jgi:HSP20 family protein